MPRASVSRPLASCLARPRGDAPVFCTRFLHEVLLDPHWELWEGLSKRQLTRPTEPSSLMITMFGSRASSESSQFPDPQTNRPGSETSNPFARVDVNPPRPSLESPDVDSATRPELPRKIARRTPQQRSWLLQVHKNLGHPDAKKLSMVLKQQGASPEITEAVPDLQCPTCWAHQQPKLGRPSSIHLHRDFNDRISMDGVTWTAQNGVNYHFYHVIDESSAFHLARASPQRDTQAAILALRQIWLHWAGPCKELWVDAGTEFCSEEFATFLQQQNIRCRTIATDAHWQLGRAERHGGILQTMLNKYDTEHPIQDLQSFQEALEACCLAKNQLARVQGYTPEILVLGKSTALPGSILGDEACSAHALADHDGAEGLAFRDNLFRREVARRAFVSADNSESLRRAILRRSRPQRDIYACGDTVMFWKAGNGAEPGRWHGPGRVLSQDAHNVIWISQLGSPISCGPRTCP